MTFTKIVATIGPASEDTKVLQQLLDAGVNVFRLNFSHGDYSWHGSVIDRIRKLKAVHPPAIMLDSKGPQIRTGDLKVPVELKKGDELILTVTHSEYETSGKLQISYDDFINDVEVSDVILIDGGEMQLKVKSKEGIDIMCEVLEGGELTSRRHVNLPGKKVSLDTITEKDWEDIQFGIEKDVDFIALSFVRNAEDILELRKFLEEKNSKIDIVSKIETAEAVENLEEIIEASDEIMIARGDLGAEVPFTEVPRIQKEIIDLCAMHQKSVIVATQMLESMMHNPIPTRAEVTDVSNAVFERADATMLSGETAAGEYPVKCVEVMRDIMHESEKNILPFPSIRDLEVDSDPNGLSKTVAHLSEDLPEVGAIVVITPSGSTARLVSSFRPDAPLLAFTNQAISQRKMQLLWGVQAFLIDFCKNDPEATVQNARAELMKHYPEFKKQKVILVSGFLVEKEFVPTIQIREL